MKQKQKVAGSHDVSLATSPRLTWWLMIVSVIVLTLALMYLSQPISRQLKTAVIFNPNTNNSFAPQNVTATGSPSSRNIFVRWDPVNSTRVTGYKVYRVECVANNCASPLGQPPVGTTSGAVAFLDTSGLTSGKFYAYYITSLLGTEESNAGNASLQVQAGQNGGAMIGSGILILPYNTPGILSLTFGGSPATAVNWSSSHPNLVAVDNHGNITVANNASPTGGVAFITATSSSQNNFGTIVVVVWPRGDLDGDFSVNSVDQNNVAVGWTK